MIKVLKRFLPYSDLSSDINRFEITLSNKTKKSKESDICEYRCLIITLWIGLPSVLLSALPSTLLLKLQ